MKLSGIDTYIFLVQGTPKNIVVLQ